MRVLVVEDEVNVAEALERGLSADGFTVHVERDGRDALDLALASPFDVIVLDILLPGLNGYRVCRALREAGVTTPILMLTSKDGEYDVADGLDLGADDYMTKPFSFVVLRARLHALIRRAVVGDRASALLTTGDLVIDPIRRTCSRNGTSIPLTRREFDLLEVLVRNNRMVVSKDALLEQVWGSEHDGNHNLLEVYIGYLRRKVDKPFDEPLIETVRGHGYRVAA